jgi:beta-aspartyl-peptidase (threonine type)
MILVAGDGKNSGGAITWALLREGKTALDAIEQGIRAVEGNPEDHTVGLGGYPNASGEVELDAGVMDGRTRASGAVGALKGYLHPVTVAYAVMNRLPHVLLVGAGAAEFAEEIGAERAELLTGEMREKWLAWRDQFGESDPLIDRVLSGKDPRRSGGTTVYLAQDRAGDLAVATSTSGWAWKYPGRLGDTPIAGAGFYADNRYGAAACTGNGEIAIRSGLARMTVALMQMGRSVEEAVREALADIRYHPDQNRGITLYAINPHGAHYVGYVHEQDHPVPHYVLAVDGDEQPAVITAHDLGG